MTPQKHKIEYVPVGSLKPAAYNPRTMDTDEMRRLRLSLRTYGFVDPVIAQKSTRLVIGGHQRLDAAKAEGYTEVPVVFVDIDDKHAMALNLALNRISGEFDYRKLSEVIAQIDTGEIKNMEITGFALDEIEKIMTFSFSDLKTKHKPEQSESEDNTVICPRCSHEFEV